MAAIVPYLVDNVNSMVATSSEFDRLNTGNSLFNEGYMQTRRKFVGCGTCALLLLGCGDKASEQRSSPSQETAEDEVEASFDPCEIVAEQGWYELPLSSFPALNAVGGYVTTSVGGQSMVIAHVFDGCYAAVASSCTHQGGNIYYSEQRLQFSCQLHAATFNLDGEWALGQVTTNLRSYLVSKEGDSLWIEV